MTDLALLAEEMQANERTLRRAANRGTIRCYREGPRRISLPSREHEYVRTRWPLLAHLIRALRTLPHVSLAILYGSFARGEERLDNDIAVLAQLGLEEMGLPTGDAPFNLRRLESEGVIGKDLRRKIADIHRVRNDAQHDYPDVRAKVIYQAAEQLTTESRRFLTAYLRWLQAKGYGKSAS